MGSYQLKKKCLRVLGVCIGFAISGLLLHQPLQAASNPPVGTVWSIPVRTNPGENGELNVTWSIKLEELTASKITFRYTFEGEFGFVTSQACNNPTAIPIPFDRLALTGIVNASGASKPAPLLDESPLSSKLDYRAPSFVNCWALANPPVNYPNAISYVKYQNLKFSSLHVLDRTSYFEQGVAIQLNATTNASPNGVAMHGGSVPVPPIDSGIAVVTSTSVKSSMSSTQTSPTNSTVSDTTPSTTLAPVDSTAPVDTTPGGLFVDTTTTTTIHGNPLATETVTQAEKRRTNTANSLGVTVAVLASALTAAAPAVGAAGAAGAAGGVVGTFGIRAFSRRDLFSHVPTKTSGLSESRIPNEGNAIQGNQRKGGDPDIYVDSSESLENSFQAPRRLSSERGGEQGVTSPAVGRLFEIELVVLQKVSRARLLRVSLRRAAELALINPLLTLAVPLVALVGSTVVGALGGGQSGANITQLIVLFLLAVTAPIFAVIATVGWAVGRLAVEPGDVFVVMAESVALLPGLLIIPMMMRGLIGPRGKSKKPEHVLSLIAAPVVAAFAFKSWIGNLSDVASTIMKVLAGIPGVDIRTPVFVATTSTASLITGVGMALLVLVIALLATRYSDDHGEPIVMFRRFIDLQNPTQMLRREYVEHATIELGHPSKWTRIVLYLVAFSVITFSLFEVVGWPAVALSSFFLVGVVVAQRNSRLVLGERIHPVMKAVPMTAIGLALGGVSVSSGRVLLAFIGLAIFSFLAMLVRPRSLWT